MKTIEKFVDYFWNILIVAALFFVVHKGFVYEMNKVKIWWSNNNCCSCKKNANN